MAASGFRGADATPIPRSFGVEHGVTLDEKDFMMLKEALGEGPMPEQGQLQAAMEALSWMEVDSEGGGLSPQHVEEEGQVAPAMAFGSKERHEYLDEYLRRYENPDDPEWREVYNERWTEFYPGHPMFIGDDLKNIKRWNERARQGLPVLPGHAGSTSPQQRQPQPQQQPSSNPTLPASTPNQPDSSQPLPTSTTTSGTCQHLKTSRRGTNRHIDMLTCLDCGVVLKREKKEVTAAGSTTMAATPGTGVDCKCHNVTWKGTNGFRWKKTCLDCGRVLVGTKDSYVAAGGPKTGASSLMSSAAGLTFTPDELADVFSTCMVVAKVKALELPDQRVSVDGLHRILDAVLVSRSPGVQGGDGLRSQQAGVSVTTTEGGRDKDGKLMTFGAYRGKPFSYARMDGEYVRWCQSQTAPSRPMREFLDYVNSRDRVAYVAEQDYAGEEAQHVAPEDHLIAVLDLGCNKTCHGDRWLQRYCVASGRPMDQLPLLPEGGGSFKGIGGHISTSGTRNLDVSFELDEESGFAVGDLSSVELCDSDAPLLLSITDQRKLGLSVELSEAGDRVYSARLGAYLKVADMNGLLGIRLLPSDLAFLGLSGVTDPETATTSDKPEEVQQQQPELQPQAQDEDPFGLQAVREYHLDLTVEPRKIMSRGQKKNMEQNIQEVKASDVSLWATLQNSKQNTPLPRGCKVFLMEVFAGAAVLTSMAMSMGLSVAAPVDISYDGTDLLVERMRRDLEEEIERQDPYCLTFAPVCGPWGPWSRLNMSKSESTAASIMDQRDAWYPCLQWIKKIVLKRLQRGRKVLVENPWASELWLTIPMDKLIQQAPQDAESGEPLELIRGDQCEYGLCDQQSGLPHLKPTGFLTASPGVKKQLSRRCQGLHVHQPLEGGRRTKEAQQWPERLCKAMLDGFLAELHERTVMAAFHEAAVEEEEESYDLGSLDYVQDGNDLAKQPQIAIKEDAYEISRQEQMEEVNNLDVMEAESERKRKWLKAPREVRIAIRRLHCMMGHLSNSAMLQLLRTAGASQQACESARHFACETCRKRQPVQRPPVTREPNKLTFNHEISCDCFEVKDSAGNRHTILSVICLGTLFHQAYWVAPGGVPRSSICADAILGGWFQPFGSPRIFTCDRGVHNQGRLKDLLRIHGVVLRYAGVEAPFQIGRTERQGGILKSIIKMAVEERQILGNTEMKWLISECTMVKNCRLNHHGFTPAQWVLGRLPRDATSLTSEEATAGALGVQQEILDGDDAFSRQLEIRQSAKMAFSKADSARRVRSALLRKSVPLRGPYQPGDLVSFYRKEKWHGPGRIIGKEGRSTFWLVHAGIPIVVAESQIRPATTAEVLTKQLLDLRPQRKRKRDLQQDGVEDEDASRPFQDDLEVPLMDLEDGQQPSYVELPEETPPLQEEPYPLPAPPDGGDQVEVIPVPPGLGHEGHPHPDHPMEDEIEEIPVPLFPEGEPESEQVPPTPMLHPNFAPPVPEDMSLTTALRRSPAALDGVPELETPMMRGRSRSPLREASRIPIHDPEIDRGLLAQREQWHFHCFLAKRVFKKKRQVGAGREVNFDKSTEEIQSKLLVTREKEWNNWKQFNAVRVLAPHEQDGFFKQNPETEIIPTRWVDTDKAEAHEESVFKSRLVARGDMEKNNNLRTDSPTSSQLFLNLVISFAACTGSPLKGGDISAAFLQGTGIQRLLALKLPAGGVPDSSVEPGSLLLCEKSVYGTRDAPRGFWKGLHDVLVKSGLLPVPYETSAYYLPGPKGEICGLLGCHVDDLLWCGGEKIDDVMTAVQKHYNFRMTSNDEFKFCGRTISRTADGITVTCPNVLDRVKNIYISPERRQLRGEGATAHEISQLRSVVGSLSWYSRVCRPDLAFPVNQLQSAQQKARIDDLIAANKLLAVALRTKEAGVFYPAGVMDFNKAMILSVTDASHGASFDVDENGNQCGHRSQSGRLLALVDEGFADTGRGKVHLLQWSSSVLRRVCRSTLQAETLSLQLGSEDAEHLRQMFFVMKNLSEPEERKKNRNYVGAMDHQKVMWCTDCRSLSDHLMNPNSSEVSDKRLAIDLTGLRQEVWRECGQLVGNPTYTDELPKSRTTLCSWISTKTMAADGLTKHMKCPQLEDLMKTGSQVVEFEAQTHAHKENYGCES